MSEQIRLRPCPLCGNGSAQKIVCEEVIPSGHKRKWPENWQVSLESTRLVKCNTCGFCYVWEDIPDELLFLLYQQDFNFQQVFDDRDSKVDIYSKVLSWLYTKRGRLLDVGCFEGCLLYMAREVGWEVTGVEWDMESAEFARTVLGIPVVTSTLKDAKFPNDSFDAVTFIDVLEHLKDPLGTLKEVQRILKPGGEVVISVPNFPFQFLKEKRIKPLVGQAGGIADVMHLNLFTKKTLDFALTQARLEPLLFSVPPIHYSPKAWKGARRRVGNIIRRTYYRFSLVAEIMGIPAGASILALARK